MLRDKVSIIYLALFLCFVAGAFLLIPAAAKQGQGDQPAPSPSSGKGGKLEVLDEDGDNQNLQEMMKALEDKEKELIRREEALKREEEKLNVLKSSLDLSLKEYADMRDKLQKELAADAGKSGQSQQWIGYVAKIYESMAPEEAAQRIEKMDGDMAVALLSRIKSKQAGKILGAIPVETAATLTKRIAEKKGDK